MSHARRATGSGVTILVASTAAALALVPVFLLGATGPFIRADLGFGAGLLGLVVSTYWLAMAVSGAPCGRLVHRWGAATGLRVGAAMACCALLVVALAPSSPVLFVGVALGGIASATITPATDVAVIERVPERLLAVAFGVKQSSLPAASLLAGIGIPTLAVTVGWRWTFIAVMLLALPTLVLVRVSWNDNPGQRRRRGAGEQAAQRESLTGLRPLVLGMGLAMAAVSATGAFYVESALQRGVEPGTAGLLLASGSALGIAGRFVFTWRLSGHSDPFAIVALLGAMGAMGVFGIAVSDSVMTLLPATLVAFGAGWGWNGLFTHAVVANHRAAAARASGMLVTASATGGVLGPATFGLVSTGAGLWVAWSCVGTGMLAASALWLFASRSGRRARGAPRSGAAIGDLA